MEGLKWFDGACDWSVKATVEIGEVFEVFGAESKGLGDLRLERLIIRELKMKCRERTEVFESREDWKTFFRLVAIIDMLEGREKFVPLEEFCKSWALCYPRVGEIIIANRDFFTFKVFQSLDILFCEDSKLKSVVDAFLGSLIDLKSLCLHEWFGDVKRRLVQVRFVLLEKCL